jgi:hypothetical protein
MIHRKGLGIGMEILERGMLARTYLMGLGDQGWTPNPLLLKICGTISCVIYLIIYNTLLINNLPRIVINGFPSIPQH